MAELSGGLAERRPSDVTNELATIKLHDDGAERRTGCVSEQAV